MTRRLKKGDTVSFSFDNEVYKSFIYDVYDYRKYVPGYYTDDEMIKYDIKLNTKEIDFFIANGIKFFITKRKINYVNAHTTRMILTEKNQITQ